MSAFNIIESDDGLSYRVEWDMHYITDEQADKIRAYIESLQDENERLRSCLSDSAENERIIDHEFRELQAENEKLQKERDALDHLTDVLNATNDGLIAENVRLREQGERLFDKTLELATENDKLRGLMRELLTDPDAWDYDYLKYRMCELGVEQ